MVARHRPDGIWEGVRQRVDHLLSLTDPVRTDPGSPWFFLDITEGLHSCALLRDYLVQSMKLLWKEAFDNEIKDYNLGGNLCLMAIGAALRTYQAVRSRAREVQIGAVSQDIAPGFGEAMAAFEQVVADTEALRQDFQGRWPWFDQDKRDESIAMER